ncbi:uncharacterized protein LOC144139188 [Haemaphysalis longicornis]
MYSVYGFGIVLAAVILTPGASAATTCTNATLSDVFGIGKCLGGTVNLCGTSANQQQTVTGFTKLLQCVLTGMFNTGTPTGIINALGPIIEVFFGTSLGGFASFLELGNLSLCGPQNCTNFFKTNVTCNGTITLLIPSTGNASSCVKNTNFCTAGTTASPQGVNDFTEAIDCLLQQVASPQQLGSIFSGIACQLRQGLSGLSSMAGPFSGLVTAFTTFLLFSFPSCNSG